jgi:dTDP-4-dehydrorhamnose 3,5-epimerase
MNKVETALPGVWEIVTKVHTDNRGYFLETHHQARLRDLGITDTFVQVNQSCSKKGTIRAFHYQLKHPQARLCRIVEGEAFDVVVDIRTGSPTFGKWISLILSSEKQNQIYIPKGFAHGLQALTDNVQCIYKCGDYYDPADGYGIVWNDPDLNIPWPIASPLVSEKDSSYPKLAEVSSDSLPRY